jgi:chromosome segregation ATPase
MDSADIAEIKRHFGVVAEGLESRIQQLADGLAHLDEKVERRFDALETRMNEQFEETRAMIRLSYAELDRRLRALEDGYSNLESRVERLEGR